MKIGIMQPYLFPYIGYFQLMELVDIYVIADEVQYIKQGYMNRNFLLPASHDEEKHRFTFSVQKDNRDKLVKERSFSGKLETEREQLLCYLNAVYRNAPYYRQTMEVLNKILFYEDRNVSKYLSNSIMKLAEYLGITTEIHIQSEIPDEGIHRQCQDRNDRIFAIAQYFGANHYINSIGGLALYRKEAFLTHALKLSFIKRGGIRYRQFTEVFVPDLSIIDVMMFNSVEEIQVLLQNYEFVEE